MKSSALSIGASVDVGHIQCSLHAVAESARKINTRNFEIDDRPRLRAELVPAVVQVMDDAVGVLGHVLARYDQPQEVQAAADSGIFDCVFDEMVADLNPSNPRQRLADISFMARWELDRKRSTVAEAEHGRDDWRLIAECSSARRRVFKAASGVERVLSEIESRPSLFGDLYQTERCRALETRAAYYSFVSGLRTAEQTCDDVGRCVRMAGIGIARLVGRSIYEELRVEDRRLLRSLQARLLEWLRGAPNPCEGERLLSEINSCGSLLMEVNRRPILIEHDREVLERVLQALALPVHDHAALHGRLASIRGRDPELDQLIETGAELVPRLWRAPVEQVLDRLCEQTP